MHIVLTITIVKFPGKLNHTTPKFSPQDIKILLTCRSHAGEQQRDLCIIKIALKWKCTDRKRVTETKTFK